MAFLNFLKTGSYSRIENLIHNKDNNYIHFDLMIFEDQTKAKLLAMRPFEIHGKIVTGCRVRSILTTLPETTDKGAYFLYNDVSSVRFALFVNYPEGEKWDFKNLNEEDHIYVEDEDKAYQTILDTATGLVTISDLPATHPVKIYEKYFSIPAMEGDGNNSWASAYEYLKTMSEFSSVVDV